jgi:hypothetical protein
MLFVAKRLALVCAPSFTYRSLSMNTLTFQESILTHVASISAILVAAMMSVTLVAMMLQ